MPAIGLIDRDYYRYIPKRQQHSLVGWTSALECARNGRFELGLRISFSQKSLDRAVSKRSSSLGNRLDNFKDRRSDRIVDVSAAFSSQILFVKPTNLAITPPDPPDLAG